MAETMLLDRVGRRLIDALLVIAGLMLAWTMASRGLAGALSEARPDLAIRMAPQFADARLALATKALLAGRAGQATALAQSAIRSDPGPSGNGSAASRRAVPSCAASSPSASPVAYAAIENEWPS